MTNLREVELLAEGIKVVSETIDLIPFDNLSLSQRLLLDEIDRNLDLAMRQCKNVERKEARQIAKLALQSAKNDMEKFKRSLCDA